MCLLAALQTQYYGRKDTNYSKYVIKTISEIFTRYLAIFVGFEGISTFFA
jgi:hypothetical protein